MKKIIFILIALITTNITNAQNYKFGKVSLDEVENNIYENF